MMRRFFLYVLLLYVAYTPIIAKYSDRKNAVVVVVPVTDAVARPLQFLDPSKSVEEVYSALPFSPEIGPLSCPRIHQFIYNEIGTLLDQTPAGTEVLVEFPHLFYEDESRKKYNQFWLPAKSVKALAEIQQKVGDYGFLPEPIEIGQPFVFENLLTLILPWKDESTGVTYSAGTRFKRAQYLDNEQSCGVCLFKPSECCVKTVLVDRRKAQVDYPKEYRLAKKLFVEILKKWAAVLPGKIAYCWGGCSFIETYTEDIFSQVPAKRGNDNLEYWVRPEAAIPHGGFDCSGLILRAAQIAGLPYFFKNTTTLGLHLKDLDDRSLEEGDLILFRNHVMVVADLKNNTMIQAVSYSSGYGIIHEIPLGAAFENATCYDELCRCYKEKTPLRMRNKKGGLLKVIDSFRLLRMIE